MDYKATMSTINECDNSSESEFDSVKHPRHYNREGAIECIDEMELIYGPEAVMWFCLLNAHKYRYRAGLKNDGFEDLEKSDWYMRKYKELKEKNNLSTIPITITNPPPSIQPPTWQPWQITCNPLNTEAHQ